VEVADGEEFTNKIPAIDTGLGAIWQTLQMCLIHGDFKHFAAANTTNFRHSCKNSSIMPAKVLSIMRGDGRRARSD
jgi:hypothetical protein